MKPNWATWGALTCLLAGCGSGSESGDTLGSGGTCDDVVACGGEIEGVWKISSNCAIGDLAQLMNITLVGEDPPEACSGHFRNFTMTMAGTVTFAAGAMVRDVVETWKGSLHFTAACLSYMLDEKLETMTAAACRRMEQQDESSKSTCAVVAGSCDCDVVALKEDSSDESYRIEGNQIATPSGDGPRMSYCVSGTTLKLKEETRDLPNFAMITTFTRK